MVSIFDILHRPILYQNLPNELHMHLVPNIQAFVFHFSKLQIPCIYKV